MKIHKGDEVIVLSGKDKGKKADVVRAIPSRERVILEGVNVAKRHAKPTRATQQGGVIEVPDQGLELRQLLGRQAQAAGFEAQLERQLVHHGRPLALGARDGQP